MVNRTTKETGRLSRRSTSEIPILTPEELDQILQKAACSRDSCLVALLYLTGRRIGEVLPLRKQDFVTSNLDQVTFKTFNEKSYRQERRTPFTIEKNGIFHYREKDGSIKEYYTRYYEAIEPQYSTRGPSGLLLNHYVKAHLYKLKPEDFLFPPYRASSQYHIKQPRAYQILRSLDERLWLHALRHMDFTRMADVYREDPVAMHRLTFHRRFESTLNYIKNLEKGDKLKKL
jgi:integrase